MQYIFVQQIWKQNPIYCAVRIIPLHGSNYSELPLTIGDQFNIKIGDSRHCIGTEHPEHGWITCVQNQNINDEMRPNISEGQQIENSVSLEFVQCLMCRNDDYYRCRRICNGDVCKWSSISAFNKCQPPDTAVYLTHIAGELKVGVSLRSEGRWLNQGSDYSTVLAFLPGLEARKIEQKISSVFDVKMSIRNLSKFRNFQPDNINNVTEEMENIKDKAQPIIDKTIREVGGERIEKLEIFDYTQYFGKYNFERPIEVINIEDNIEFGGEIVALKGSLLVVQQGLYVYGIDTKQLISRDFEFLERSAIMPGQKSLNEWFQ